MPPESRSDSQAEAHAAAANVHNSDEITNDKITADINYQAEQIIRAKAQVTASETFIWVDKVGSEGNSYSTETRRVFPDWHTAIPKQLEKRGENSSLTVNSDPFNHYRNLLMLSHSTFDTSLRPFVWDPTSAIIKFAKIVRLMLSHDAIIRNLRTDAILIKFTDAKSYIASHQDIHHYEK